MKFRSRVTLFAAVVLALSTLRADAVNVGDKAPAFALPVAAGAQRVALSDELTHHALTVVMFISTRCPYSNGYDARMEQLEKDYAARGVRILGINSNVNEPPSEVAGHARQHGFTFPVLKDERSKTADAYGALHTPEIFVVDPAGVVRYHGRIDENYEDAAAVKSPDLKNALDALLAGRAVPAASTKAFGCSIKRG
jgi:peroxiredoxin